MNERENLYAIFRHFHNAMLISNRPDGTLHVRPMAIAEIKEDGRIYFATSLDSTKIAEIERDANVVVTFQYGSQFASLAGSASIMRDQELTERLCSET